MFFQFFCNSSKRIYRLFGENGEVLDSLTTVELPSLEARTFAGMFRKNVSMSSRLTFFENNDDRAVKFPIPISCDVINSMTTTTLATTTTNKWSQS